VPIVLPFIGDTVIVSIEAFPGSGGDTELHLGLAPGKEEGGKNNRRDKNSPGIFEKGKIHKKLLYGLMRVKGT
jgi:hypothetical protein